MTRELIVDFYPVLKAVTDIKDKKCQMRLLLALSRDPEFKKCIQELANNIVNGVVPLTKRDKDRLEREARVIRKLKRAKNVTQSGGFLNIVVPLLASIVAQLIASRK